VRHLNKIDLDKKFDNQAYITVDASVAGCLEYANVFVDASELGFGGFIEETQGSEVTGSWLSSESVERIRICLSCDAKSCD
jgi:hypothetical protein